MRKPKWRSQEKYQFFSPTQYFDNSSGEEPHTTFDEAGASRVAIPFDVSAETATTTLAHREITKEAGVGEGSQSCASTSVTRSQPLGP